MYSNPRRTVNFTIFQRYLPPFFQRRWKGLSSKETSTMKALKHFDDFYGSVFTKNWPSMRLGLLSPQKYIAVINNFSDTERIISYFENLGAVNISKLYEIQINKVDGTKKSIQKKQEKHIADNEEINKTSGTATEIPLSEDRLIESSSGLSSPALSQFIPATKLTSWDDTWVPESQHYEYYAKEQDVPVSQVEQEELVFPPHLHAYSFEPGNVESFPSPVRGTTGVSDYYLLNGGSLLPVLALDLKPGDNVLDMCAAPGGKGLLSLQTLFPRTLVLNDVSLSRVNRVRKVMNEYVFDLEKRIKNEEIVFSNTDGRLIDTENLFDKILVDVPCTTDRHTVTQEDNNIYKPNRIKERIKMPEVQSELLTNALKLVKVGGTVVYSTCSLSPTQNSGVIAFTLKKLSEETDNDYVIIDMTKALEALKIIFRFGSATVMKCGHLIIPYLPTNFGPTYFCKIVRIK